MATSVTASSSPDAILDWKESLPILKTYITSSKYTKAHTLTTKLLSLQPQTDSNNAAEPPIPLHSYHSLQTIHITALIRSQQYTQTIQYIRGIVKSTRNAGHSLERNDADFYAGEEAYALYRLRKYVQALEVVEKAVKRRPSLQRIMENESVGGNISHADDKEVKIHSRLAVLHVMAQCFFRLHRPMEAMQVYQWMLDEEHAKTANEKQNNVNQEDDDDDETELLTNFSACAVNISPLMSKKGNANSDGSILDKLWQMESLAKIMGDYAHDSENKEEEEEVDYDLLYNVGTALAIHGGSFSSHDAARSTAILQKAQKLCKTTCDAEESNMTETEIRNEILPIMCNHAYCLLLNDNSNNSNVVASHGNINNKSGKSKSTSTSQSMQAKLAEAYFTKVINQGSSGATSDAASSSGGNSSNNSGGAAAAAAIAAANNLAVMRMNRGDSLFDCLKRLPDISSYCGDGTLSSSSQLDSKQMMLTPFQLRMIVRNKALLLLLMGRGGDSRKELEILRKQKTKQGSHNGDEEKVDADLMEVALLQKEDNTAEAQNLLQKILKPTTLNNLPVLVQAQIVLFQAQVMLNNNGKNNSVRNVLSILERDLPKEIHSCPSVLATIIAMNNDVLSSSSSSDSSSSTDVRKSVLKNVNTQSEELVSFLSRSDTAATNQQHHYIQQSEAFRKLLSESEFRLSLGMHEDVANTFQSLLDNDDNDSSNSHFLTKDAGNRMVCVAMLVKALSFTDPEKAEEMASLLPDISEAAEENGAYGEELELDGEALEEMELPRPNRIKKLIVTDRKQERAADRKKQNGAAYMERRLRQRAKNREVYLTKLETQGKYNLSRPNKPDPERWIPKKQRSYNKRGRKARNRFVGAQGSGMGTEKDAAKLDAFARAEAKRLYGTGGASTLGAPSSAHLDVASSHGASRKGGRRR